MNITDHNKQTRNAAGEKAAISENPSQQGGLSLAFIYFDMNKLGLSLQNLRDCLSDWLERYVRLHLTTQSGNAVLVFRAPQPYHDYQRLASHGQTEAIVLMGGATIWGDHLYKHLLQLDLQHQELPVVTETEEKRLLKLVTIMAQAVGLQVAVKSKILGEQTAKFAQAETQTKTHAL
jgi:hypothetical protein